MNDTPCMTMNPDIFFDLYPKNVTAAKAACGRCDQKQQCLSIALTNECEFGIFGGTLPEERGM